MQSKNNPRSVHSTGRYRLLLTISKPSTIVYTIANGSVQKKALPPSRSGETKNSNQKRQGKSHTTSRTSIAAGVLYPTRRAERETANNMNSSEARWRCSQ
ncbi:hypothetical protein CEXT_113701 [Caerostris extrusa]|uniref:Uncharacterized protein n=1 Tax=Caerostris extrusa TaxID=172846 RepID=A0AAV4QX87_CAEEX|nr:hypothetical protein CEXT_113701 [Caerostris extrusa]